MIVLIFIFLIIYLIQSSFFSWFTIAGIKPNLIIIYVLFIGLFTNRIYGLTLGITFGLLLDIFISKKVGISSITLGCLGLAGGFLDRGFSKDSKITIIGMVIFSTFLVEFGNYAINSILFSYSWEIPKFLIIVGIEIIYNSILTIILYPLIQKSGFRMQEIFKENKILTRYY